MSSPEPDYKFKICVIGSAGCGKSCMVDQLINKKLSDEVKPTVGVEYRPYQFTINDYIIQLELWDTAGQERYNAVTKTYFRSAVGCVLVYDTTQQSSFNELTFWLNQFRQFADPNAIIILVGNKIDLEDKREIQSDVAEQFAKDNMLTYVETSAVTGQNIRETFERVAHGLFDLVKSGKLQTKSGNNQTTLPDSNEPGIADLAGEIPMVDGGACAC